MAPERLGDHTGWQLKKADVWAIATIAFEMFVGKRCFEGNSQREVFGKIMSGQWSWPQNRTPSDSMQDLIQQCLCADASERPSAEEALSHVWFTKMRGRRDDDYKFDDLSMKPVVAASKCESGFNLRLETNPILDLLVKLSITAFPS